MTSCVKLDYPLSVKMRGGNRGDGFDLIPCVVLSADKLSTRTVKAAMDDEEFLSCICSMDVPNTVIVVNGDATVII